MIIPLADADDPRLTDYRSLTDVRERRRIEGDELFVAEGPVAIERLLASRHRVRSILVTERQQGRFESLVDGSDVPLLVVDEATMTEVVGFKLHRGAIAAADRLPLMTIAELPETTRRVAVLEGLNDPENVGLIARSARALGVDALVLDPTCIDPYTRRSVRVSMGEVLHLGLVRCGGETWPAGALQALADRGFETWAMTPAADADDVWTVPVPARVAIVVGAEGPGLARATIDAAQRRVVIPIRPDVDSLNVAAAAAITFAAIDHRSRRARTAG